MGISLPYVVEMMKAIFNELGESIFLLLRAMS